MTIYSNNGAPDTTWQIFTDLEKSSEQSRQSGFQEKSDSPTSAIKNTSDIPSTDSLSNTLPLQSRSQQTLCLIKHYFNNAQTLEQKIACLNFLLQYQHYNSDYTIYENSQLGYANPVISPQKAPGYFRTEYMRVFELGKKWLEIHAAPYLKNMFEQCNKPMNYIKISSSYAVPVLQKCYSDNYQICSLEDICKKKGTKQRCVVIDLEPKEMERNILDLLSERLSKIENAPQLDRIRRCNPQLTFLFQVKHPNIDCSVIWGAKWASPKKRNALRCVRLDSKELFGKEVYSLLNKLGAVPDRVELNAFLTSGLHSLTYPEALEQLGIMTTKHHFIQPVYKKSAKELFVKITTFELHGDTGSERYRDAILRWHDCFFSKYALLEFAAPLLFSQVAPMINEESGLVEWSKAYQNICEIVFFCIQSFPDKFSDVDRISQQRRLQFDKNFSGLVQAHKLYPYAMTAFFDIFHQIKKRKEFTEKKLSVSCIGQNYFETLCLLDKMKEKGHFSLEEQKTLNEIKQLPDVLVVDFHPNNASKEKLFQNDVAHWVKHKLNENSSNRLILLIDVTLNHLTDPILQECFMKLKPFLESGQLEIFGVQSLAKLIQLGADNFSGGACFYMGQHKEEIFQTEHTSSQKAKATFYGILSQNFQELISDYFDSVRHNTSWMYQALRNRIQDIKEHNWVNFSTDTQKKKSEEFCAAKVIMNTDENTVYVAISFQPLMQALNLPNENSEEELANKLRKLLLQIAKGRGLPLTGRQSFGFSLSNMSGVCDSIRFSIGVEKQTILQEYVNVIDEFIYALSQFFGKSPSAFSFERFKEGILLANDVMTGHQAMKPIKTSLIDDFVLDDFGIDPKIGEVEIGYQYPEIYLNVEYFNAKTETINKQMIKQENIRLALDLGYLTDDWSSGKLMKLLIKFLLLTEQSVYVTTTQKKGQYAIQKVFQDKYMFIDEKNVTDKSSGITVHFEPEFKITTKNNEVYLDKQVYVKLPNDLGNKPVRVDKLDKPQIDKIYEKCNEFNLTISPYSKSNDSIRLKFEAR